MNGPHPHVRLDECAAHRRRTVAQVLYVAALATLVAALAAGISTH
ncbi:hypothetical protein ACIQU6_34855 [Streptomyces sp. NPDC090442]